MYGVQEAAQGERGVAGSHGHRCCPPTPWIAAWERPPLGLAGLPRRQQRGREEEEGEARARATTAAQAAAVAAWCDCARAERRGEGEVGRGSSFFLLEVGGGSNLLDANWGRRG